MARDITWAGIAPKAVLGNTLVVTTEDQSLTAVAVAFGVTVETVGKWEARFEVEGSEGPSDRSSRRDCRIFCA